MNDKKESLLFRFMIRVIRRVYPVPEISGTENLPNEPCLIVSNHAKTHGPIISQLYFPDDSYTWCASQVMHLADFPGYAFEDFWSYKPKWSHWFWHVLSYLIAPFGVSLMKNAHTIETFTDNRILSTFRNTVKALQEGNHVIIFPEFKENYNHILNRFHDGFINVAKLYYKKTGQALQLVPMYIAPALKKTVIGQPIRFCPENPIDEERTRLSEELMRRITYLAEGLPLHRVIPYDNKIPMKDYPFNTYEGVSRNENTCC